MGSAKLNQLTKRASETATNTFISACIDIESNLNFKKDLKDFLEMEIKMIEDDNSKASVKKCLKCLESLYACIEKKSNKGNYLVDGGYDEFKMDMKRLHMEYQTEFSKQDEFGPSNLEVLAEFERQKVMQVFYFQCSL